MLRHLENNECHNHWTIQHLNKLAAECNGSAHFIIQGRETWFRAGAPSLTPRWTDPYHGFYGCSFCGEDFERQSQVKKHLQDGECRNNYPSVVQCPSCPGHGFDKLSKLFEHLERQGCQRGKKLVPSLVQSLKEKFEDSGVQWRLDKDSYELRVDETRPGRLYVETRMLDDEELRRRED